jgi:hypothetical protein
MTSTYTPNKSLELPGYNDYVDSWNVPVNADFTLVDTALGGSTLLNVTGVSGNVTLTSTQYRPPQLIISGTLTANVTYRIPSGVGGQWTVTNNATGAFTISMNSIAGGSTIVIPSGSTIVSCDGTSSGMRLSISSTGVTRVDSFSGGTTGLTPAVPSIANIVLGGTLNIANGGTGITTAPTNGALLIGNSSGGYTVNQLTAGSGIQITSPSSGTIKIDAVTGGVGTVTSVNVAGGTTGLTASGGPITGAGTITLGGTLGISHGGTGVTSTPASGALLIGNGTGYTVNELTAGAGISITKPAPGSITIAATGSGGTVTSVGLSGGTTGLTVTSSPITSSGTMTIGGTLATSAGGTGIGTAPSTGQVLIGNGAGGYALNTISGTSPIQVTSSAGSITVSFSGILPVANGGTGVSTSTGSGSNVLSTSPTLVTPILGTPTSGTLTNCTGYTTGNLSGTISLTTQVAGTLPVANGGTGVTTSTGSGSNVLSTSPTLVTPILGTPTSGTLTNCTGYTAANLSGSVSLTTQVSGTLPVANGGTGTNTAFTAGSVIFAGASGVYSQNNSAFFWNNTTKRLGINTPTPGSTISAIEASSAGAGYFENTSTGGGVAGIAVTSIGVNGVASSTTAGAYGVGGTNTGAGGGSGAVGVSSGSGGYAFRSLVGGYSPFTGCHDGFILKTASPLPGDLLVDGVVVGKKLSDVITEVSVSTAPNQPVIGIFVQTYPTDIANVPPSLKLPDGSPDPAWYVYAPTHNLAVINGVGEGCMNVVGEGGNIQKGDLLVASSTPGKGMKQADDIMRGYTVARAREDAVFAPGEEKQIACIYLCG